MNANPIEQRAVQVLISLDLLGTLASRLQMPGDVPDKFRIAWALLRASFDDAYAITILCRDHGAELAGSAFSLLRPMNEKFKRGTWFAFCATPEDVREFIHNDQVPKRNLAQEIEKYPPFDRFPIFSRQHQNAWTKFHSFTHGGNQLVSGYTMGHGIGSAFPEEDILKVLSHAEGIAVTAVHVMCMIAGDFEPELTQTVLGELVAAFPR